jgi:hypothetical protein
MPTAHRGTDGARHAPHHVHPDPPPGASRISRTGHGSRRSFGQLKVLSLVATERRKNRSDPTGRINGWTHILNIWTIHYGDRIEAAT